MPTLEFTAVLDREYGKHYKYSGEEREDGWRIGDLFIRIDELGEHPPTNITIHLDWS